MRWLYRRGTSPEFGPGGPIEIDWGDIIDRIPRLEEGVSTNHIQILHNNNLHPFEEKIASCYPLKTIFNTEFLGAPKAGKTSLITNISTQLELAGIPFNIHLERDIAIDPTFQDEPFNLAMFLSAASRLLDTTVNAQSDLLASNKKMQLYDRGIISSMAMTAAKERFKRRPEHGHEEMAAITRLLSGRLDALVVLNVEPNISLERGSRMTGEFLESLNYVHQQIPELIVQDELIHPVRAMPLINISGNANPIELRDFTTKSIGTIIHALYDKRTQWDERTQWND